MTQYQGIFETRGLFILEEKWIAVTDTKRWRFLLMEDSTEEERLTYSETKHQEIEPTN